MKTTVEYLDAVREMHSISSDKKLANFLGLNRTAISNYRRGLSVMDDYAALKIAKALNIEPLEAIAAANAEREKNPDKKKDWEKVVKSVAASVFIALFSVPAAVHQCILCKIADSRRMAHL